MRLLALLAVTSIVAAVRPAVATADSSPRGTSGSVIDAACDPADRYTDRFAVANDGTIFAALPECREIWRFAPGTKGDVPPASVYAWFRSGKFDINALGTSGSHLLVAGFSSVAVLARDATGNDVPLRYIGDSADDTEALSHLGTSDGEQLGVFADAGGGVFVLHEERGGRFVVQFAPGARGDVPALRRFDPSSDYPKPDRTQAVALGAAGRLYVLDAYGNVLASGPHVTGPFETIAHFAESDGTLTSLALDGRGRFIAAGPGAIHILSGALSGRSRESSIAGARTTLRTSSTDGRVGILSIGTDAAGSIYAFQCDENGRGRVVTFGANAVGDAAPASVLGGPLTHLRC